MWEIFGKKVIIVCWVRVIYKINEKSCLWIYEWFFLLNIVGKLVSLNLLFLVCFCRLVRVCCFYWWCFCWWWFCWFFLLLVVCILCWVMFVWWLNVNCVCWFCGELFCGWLFVMCLVGFLVWYVLLWIVCDIVWWVYFLVWLGFLLVWFCLVC